MDSEENRKAFNEILEDAYNEGRNSDHAKTYQVKISFELDKGFITLWPCVSINLHIKSIEINFLVFGMYIDF